MPFWAPDSTTRPSRSCSTPQKAWGDSSAIQATLAWTYQKQGQAEKGGWPQFTLYRNAINTMKRAYPQFLSVEGAACRKRCFRSSSRSTTGT